MHYDIIIVGGGLVGASLALPLAKLGLKIAVIEAAPEIPPEKPEIDRGIVLSASSQSILNNTGLWGMLSAMAIPIQDIHVSEKGRFGAVRLSAKREKVAALGYVVLAQQLSEHVRSALAPVDTIDVYYETRFTGLQRKANRLEITVTQDDLIKTLSADLLVAADGSRSKVRESVGIKTDSYEYDQHVITANVELTRSHQHVAYERFTHEGPLAMLPIGPQKMAIVWSVKPSRVDTLLKRSASQFLEELQNTFGYRLGRFVSCSKPGAFPLQMMRANEIYRSNVVVVGNAAHTLHPIAGQGLNLGLRDAAILTEQIGLALGKRKKLTDVSLLEKYAALRQADYQRTFNFTHGLVGVFSNSFLPLLLARNLGLVMLQRIPRLRAVLATSAMGRKGKQSRLASGIPIEDWLELETTHV